MDKLFLKKLKAATITESVVAMIIVMFAFGICMMIFTNVSANIYGCNDMKLWSEMKSIAHKLNNKELPAMNQIFDNGNTLIELIIENYADCDSLLHIKLIAYKYNHFVIGQYNELIYYK